MEKNDIRYALQGVARDKRFLESLQWRSEEIFFAEEDLAAYVVHGTHIYQQNLDMIDEMKHFLGDE